MLDFEETFRQHVIERFADDYAAGRTPNPCVSCNNFVKLGTLAQYADRLDARYVATGHYARIERREDGAASLPQPQLQRSGLRARAVDAGSSSTACCFRSATFDKATTREHARRFGLPVHDKTESQDICFVEGGDYRDVRRTRPSADWPSAAPSPTIAATSSALTPASRTIRSGSAHTCRRAATAPRYVTRIDPATNTIVVGRELRIVLNLAHRR